MFIISYGGRVVKIFCEMDCALVKSVLFVIELQKGKRNSQTVPLAHIKYNYLISQLYALPVSASIFTLKLRKGVPDPSLQPVVRFPYLSYRVTLPYT